MRAKLLLQAREGQYPSKMPFLGSGEERVRGVSICTIEVFH